MSLVYVIDVVGVCHRCRWCMSLVLSVCAIGVVGVCHRSRRHVSSMSLVCVIEYR